MNQNRNLDEFVPVTFVERGIAIQFTSPGLEQARMRLTAKKKAELLIQNLSGGRGIYIMNWQNVCDSLPVTTHDHLLMDALSDLSPIDPYKVRKVMLSIAAEGAAGMSAAEVALSITKSEYDQMLLTQLQLIIALLNETGARQFSMEEIISGGPPVQELLRATLRRLAPKMGQDSEQIIAHMEALGELIYPLGLPSSLFVGRLRQLLTGIEDAAEQIKTWAINENADNQSIARFVVSGMSLTTAAARNVLALTDRELSQTLALLKSWTKDPDVLRQRVLRSAWLLDGWDHIVSLWNDALGQGTQAEREAVTEMSQLIPALPREALEWTGMKLENAVAQNRMLKKWVKSNEDWRGKASILEVIERNEKRKARVA